MENYLNKITVAAAHYDIHRRGISNDFYLSQKLEEKKILKYFFTFSTLGWTKLRGKVVRIEGNEQCETEIESRRFARIHSRCKNRVNNEKQATANWFNTVEIWSGLIKVERFLSSIFNSTSTIFFLFFRIYTIIIISQSIYWIEIELCKRILYCSIYFFLNKSFKKI